MKIMDDYDSLDDLMDEYAFGTVLAEASTVVLPDGGLGVGIHVAPFLPFLFYLCRFFSTWSEFQFFTHVLEFLPGKAVRLAMRPRHCECNA